MQVRAELQIPAAMKAMAEVVLPAVDPDDQLAQQQAQLVMGTLALLGQHLPLAFRRDVDELERLVALAGDLRAQAEGGVQTGEALAELATAAERGAEVLERAKADPAELVDALSVLRSAGGHAVTAVFADGGEASQEAVQRTVLAMAEEQLLRDRAWLVIQQWEPDPGALPPVGSLLPSVRTGG